MSRLYKASEASIRRRLSNVPEKSKPLERLKIDLAAILTGPTSGANAADLAQRVTDSGELNELAATLIEIGERFLESTK